MNKKSKSIIVFIAVLLTYTCLSACNNKGEVVAPAAEVEASAVEEASLSDDTADNAVEEDTESTVDDEKVTLKDIYAEHGIKAGTCISPSMISAPAMEAIILEQFNSITPENAMKTDFMINKTKSIEAGDIVVEFNSDLVKILDWAKANNMAVRGHNFIWHEQTPDWIFYENFDPSGNLASRDEMLSRMESYIRQVFEKLEESGYIDMFYAYDVVNEAITDDGTMRDSKWKEVIGDDYVYYAFYYANMYAPESIDLYYNDYNEQYKAGPVTRFVETLKDEDGNYLIDGIGLQGHLYTQDDMNKYMLAVKKYGETGLKVEITELDVALGTWQNVLDGSDENLKKQGVFFYNIINGVLEKIDEGSLNMDSITFWGFDDELSWKKQAKPLLYDKDLKPKYAFYGAAQVEDLAGF
ncbi:MAG: endo-1,4-beta-xylanase [Lachnospiraceae bacterium]|nr:endo-1,4-beta-xylanase [Lachnospiraceae bacterium]